MLSESSREVTCYFKRASRGTISSNNFLHLKNHSNTLSQKDNDNSPVTKLKVTEYCELTGKRIQNSLHEESQKATKKEQNRKAVQ